jgi:hypothetical protein
MFRNRIRKHLAPHLHNRISSAAEVPAGVVLIPVAQLPAALQAMIPLQQQLYQMAHRQAQAQQLAMFEDWLSS